MRLGIIVFIVANLTAVIATFLFLYFANQKPDKRICKQARILRKKELYEKYNRVVK